MSLGLMYDVTGANFAHAPNGQLALYVTGSSGVPSTQAQRNAHPDAVLIDQTPAAGQWDDTADVDDYERGAVALNELAPRAKERQAAFKNGKRPGQRMPTAYFSASDVHTVVNALVNGGVKSGVGLWVANWNLNDSQAIALVAAAAGPFPIVAVQFRNAGLFDISVVSTAWLSTRSRAALPPPPPVKATVPPGQWADAHAWTWKAATLTGVGLDNGTHEFDYDPKTGKWPRKS